MLRPALSALLLAAAIPAAAHEHDLEMPAAILDLPAADAPALDVAFAPADDGGWNVTFAATRAGAPLAEGEAQVRVAVGSEEPAIASAGSYHLPRLEDGVHQITVGLYTADGRAYARDGVLLGRRVVVLQSGGNAALAAPTVFDAAIVAGRLTGASDTLTTRQGTATEIRFTSDSDLELHLHGYDIEATVSPAWPVSLLFDAAIPGRFPLESHGGAGEAVILYLEVYP
jgi:hypothetical protein